jgi:hypothetical protein
VKHERHHVRIDIYYEGGEMSAKEWKEYQEHQKNVAYLQKEYGEEGFWELMQTVSKLKAQGVNVVKLLQDGIKEWDAAHEVTPKMGSPLTCQR